MTWHAQSIAPTSGPLLPSLRLSISSPFESDRPPFGNSFVAPPLGASTRKAALLQSERSTTTVP